MLGKIIRKGEVMLCGTCMDARGLRAEELMEGALRGTLAQLADWTPLRPTRCWCSDIVRAS